MSIKQDAADSALNLMMNADPYLRKATQDLYADPLSVPGPITFSERMTLKIGNHTFQIILLPGHTSGQTGVCVPEEKVFFASDDVTASGAIGPLNDAVHCAYLESLNYIRGLDVDCIQTGHGDLVTRNAKACVESLHKSLTARIRAVEKSKHKGMSIAEASERWEQMFPFDQPPASKGFRPYSRAFGVFQLAHLSHVIGGNS